MEVDRIDLINNGFGSLNPRIPTVIPFSHAAGRVNSSIPTVKETLIQVCMKNTYGLLYSAPNKTYNLLSLAVLHSEDLYNTNKYVEHIELETDRLLHWITYGDAALS